MSSIGPSTSVFPLTRAQAGVWFAQQLDPDNPIFNTAECIELRGDVSIPALVGAVRDAVGEAEVLTAAVEVASDGSAYLRPGAHSFDAVPVHDLRDHDDPEAAARDLMEACHRTVVDPRAESCVRAAVLQLDDRIVLLYLGIHHLVIDAYGFGLLMRRIAEIYTADVRGEERPACKFTSLAPVVAEEAAYRESPRFEADRVFWTDYLDDASEAVTLAGGGAGIARASRGMRLTLSAEQQRGLSAVGRAARASWGDVLTAAVAIYLRGASGRGDIVVGFPVMNRLGSAALAVPMSAVNVVPLRLEPAPSTTVVDLVGQVRDAVARCRDHYRYRGEDIQNDLRLPSGSRGVVGPSVNVKPFGDRLRFGDLYAAVHSIVRGPLQDLMVTARPLDHVGGLEVWVDVDAERYTADELATHTGRLAHLLDSLAALEDPGATALAGVPILPSDERRTLLARAAGKALTVPTGLTLPDLLQAQVERDPDAPAVSDGTTSLTFGELASRARRLARNLLAGGLGPHRRVAVALPRGVDTLVALFAVLEAGGTCVPVDPDHPADRIAHVLDETGPGCVVTNGAVAQRLREVTGTSRVVDITALDLSVGEDHPVSAAERGHRMHDLDIAYVIHTSGSTGRPKGVEVPHRGAVNLFHSHRDRVFSRACAVAGRDRLRVGHAWSFAFDASWGPHLWMLAGHELRLVDEETQRDPERLAAQARAEEWHFVELSPSQLEHIVDADLLPADIVPTLGFGGDAVSENLWRRLRERGGTAFNFYGPTEGTVDVVVAEIVDATEPVIGVPVANLAAYVLDSGLEPVPDGVPGELYVAGPGVVRGYLGAAAVTAARIVANPFCADPAGDGARLYRTGDIVHRRPDGQIVYRGRTDDQIKIRGFRVELGEVESALLRLPGATRAVATTRPDATGSVRLVGYVVGADGDPIGARELLANWLPAYMVPSAFVFLDALPLTSNGKVDRKRLPEPDFGAVVSTREPSTELQRVLCALVADVLGLDAVGVDDDFFLLGGHSLAAAKLIARVSDAVGVELAIRAVFDNPTVLGLAEQCEVATGAGRRPPVLAVDRGPVSPLSAAQQRLWFQFRLEGPSSTYNIPVALRLRGVPDPAALSVATDALLRRHEVLRTLLEDVDGIGMQRVCPVPDTVPFEVEHVAPHELDAVLAAAARHPFDLDHEFPIRLRLFVTGTESVLLVLTHHIASDELSTPVLMRDLGSAYRAAVAGENLSLTDLPVQYADYALWQRDLLGEGDDPAALTAVQQGFWRARLAGAPEEIALPADRRRPAVPTFAGGVVERAVSAGITDDLRASARAAGASMFMLSHTALAVALAGSGAGHDIVVGTPTAGRPTAELDQLVGFFVNLVVLRTDLSGDPTLTELVGRVRSDDLEAYAHQDLPFDRLVEAVNPERSAPRHPLFQVLVQHRMPPVVDEFAEFAPSVVTLDTGAAMFDLTVDVVEVPGDGLRVRIEYAQDLFDAATAEALVDRVVRALTALARTPQLRLSAVDLLSADERVRLTRGALTPAVIADVPTAAAAFDRQVARTPNVPALVDARTELTFAELSVRVNRLARHLIAHGVGPETVVGLQLPRGTDIVIAALAVWQAGGAYLPIDPAYPADRIAHMLADAAPVLVLDEYAIAAVDPTLPSGPLAVGERNGTPCADNAAYVIYTSGSTGVPKGVVVPHRGVVNLLATQRRRTFGPADDRRRRVLLTYALAFDSAIDPLLSMLSGHTLHVLDTDLAADAAGIVEYVRRHHIDAVDCVPLLMAELLREGLLDATAAHRPGLLAVGGEAVPAELWSALAGADGIHATNMYGPTECTVDATIGDITGSAAHIGSPVDGARAYVLDARMRLVPGGVPGELYVGGPGVTRGYLNRPGLTAERFVADLYGGSGERLYRTGDLVRWTSREGAWVLEYLGRTDDQVKIRGFRIELGEVESVLAAHPAVAAATVVAREDDPGRRRLVGYAAVRAATDGEALREHLAARLPAHMVPAAVVLLDALPVTPNGKVNRRALPAPDFTASGSAQDAGSDLERRLCAVVTDVLGVDDVGPGDDFFSLGGDSIVSIQLVSRARAAGVRFTARDVFEHRTVAGLAAVAETDAEVAPVDPSAALGFVPATPIVHDLLDRGGPYRRFAQSRLLRAPDGLTLATLTRGVQALLDTHDALRASFDDRDRVFDVPPPGTVPAEGVLTCVDIRGAGTDARREAVRRATDDAYGRLDPAAGAMFRAVLLDAGETESLVLLVIHHLVVDGVSWRILVPDLADACAGKSPAAPGTPLRTWARGLVGTAAQRRDELALWQAATVSDRETIGRRAVDPLRDRMSGTETLEVSAPVEVTEALLTAVPDRFNARVDDVLLTALALAVARIRGSGALSIDLEGHGREEQAVPGVDLSRTVGWFTTLYPVRLDVAGVDLVDAFGGGGAAGDALKSVKEQMRRVPDNGIGYGVLRHLDPVAGPALAAGPAPEIGFNYLGRFTLGEGAGGAWTSAPGSGTLGGAADGDMPVSHAIEIGAVTEDSIDGPILRATWGYSPDVVDAATVRSLATAWVDALRALSGQAASGHAGGLTPSDLTLTDLDQAEIDEFELEFL
ncbi:amino acid adenylation domain-containing protein [Prescottella equi]